ncbi:MAG: sulfotransferase family protein [Actinomycetota bacterium]
MSSRRPAHPVHVLWAVPRATSTAFEWMVRNRGDLTCFHEPFCQAWYRGDDARWPRLDDDAPRSPGMTFATQLEEILDAAETGPVFVKDFPTFVTHLWSPDDDGFLDLFNHSFLTRDPAKVLVSAHRQWGEWFHPDEIGFDHQRAMFDHLHRHRGTPPPLIDSDDLLTDPARVVAAWCRAVGLPYLEEALTWDAGDRQEVGWFGGGWHESLKGSTGLRPQPTSSADLSGQPDWLLEMHDAGRPDYDRLQAFKL